MREHLDRIMRRVEVDTLTACWLWTGSAVAESPRDYGRTSIDGRLWLTHRAVYTIMVGPIAPRLDLHHKCETPRCCNPDHLIPIGRSDHNRITGQGDWRAAFELAKTQCPEGHPYDADNTYVTPRGHRQCRICKRAAQKRSYQRHRSKRIERERQRRAAKRRAA